MTTFLSKTPSLAAHQRGNKFVLLKRTTYSMCIAQEAQQPCSSWVNSHIHNHAVHNKVLNTLAVSSQRSFTLCANRVLPVSRSPATFGGDPRHRTRTASMEKVLKPVQVLLGGVRLALVGCLKWGSAPAALSSPQQLAAAPLGFWGPPRPA